MIGKTKTKWFLSLSRILVCLCGTMLICVSQYFGKREQKRQQAPLVVTQSFTSLPLPWDISYWWDQVSWALCATTNAMINYDHLRKTIYKNWVKGTYHNWNIIPKCNWKMIHCLHVCLSTFYYFVFMFSNTCSSVQFILYFTYKNCNCIYKSADNNAQNEILIRAKKVPVCIIITMCMKDMLCHLAEVYKPHYDKYK